MIDLTQGRVIALEILMRGFIAEAAMKQDDPLGQIRQWREGAIAFIKGLDPKDPHSQKLIEDAEKAFGSPSGYRDRWEHRYRHWRFRPQEFVFDEEAIKPR